MVERPPDKIVDKIAKLLNLSRGKGTTSHEAATAAAHAQRLMDRYRLDLASVDKLHATADDVKAFADEPLDRLGRPVIWKTSLGAELAGLNSCRLVALPSRRRAGAAELILIGVADDVAIVRHLYTYLAREIDRLAGAALKQERQSRPGWSRMKATWWGLSFRLGMVNAIVSRLRREKQQARSDAAAGDSRALVLLDTHEQRVLAFCDIFVKGPSAYGRPSDDFHQNLEAHVAGRRAAHSIALHAPLTAAGSPPTHERKT